MQKLQRSTPWAEGLDPKTVLDLLHYYDQNQTGVQSIMILRHGRVVAEAWWNPYRAEFPHMLFSMSKSFTSIAVGFAVQEGLLSIHDKLLDFFPDILPPDAGPCDYMKELTLRDMLRMATGHVTEPPVGVRGTNDGDWMFRFLSSYIEKKPGTHYLYNTAATYMLSAVVQRVSGMKLVDYLKPRLFDPLGFGEYWWEQSPEGVSAGGTGFHLQTEDIAKFGLFLLNKGSYGGERLLDAKWIEQATAKQIDFTEHINIDSRQGYGYQFWRCQPEESYRAAGAFAQFCVVLPKQDMVVAVTSGAQDTQPVLTALWDILLPGLRSEAENVEQNQQTLEAFAAGLTVPTAVGEPDSPEASAYWKPVYELSENPLRIERVAFSRKDGENRMRLTIGGIESEVPLGYSRWVDSAPACVPPVTSRDIVPVDRNLSACGAWTSPNTFRAVLCYNRTPFRDILDFHFDAYGFKLHHQRKTGFHLVDDFYFGRPVTDPLAVSSQSGASPKAEFRF